MILPLPKWFKPTEPDGRWCYNCRHWQAAYAGIEYADCAFHAVRVQNLKDGAMTRSPRTNKFDVCGEHSAEHSDLPRRAP